MYFVDFLLHIPILSLIIFLVKPPVPGRSAA